MLLDFADFIFKRQAEDELTAIISRAWYNVWYPKENVPIKIHGICDVFCNSFLFFLFQGDPGPPGPRGFPGSKGDRVSVILSHNIQHGVAFSADIFYFIQLKLAPFGWMSTVF